MALTLSNQFLAKPLLRAPPRPTAASVKTTASRLPQISCRKKDVHPQFYLDAKVYCNGEHVMTTGGTQKEYSVDMWAGNHPFYLGKRTSSLLDDDQVSKFMKKYGDLGKYSQIPVLTGEVVIPPRKFKNKPKKK